MSSGKRGRVVVIGCGPAGMASALSIHQAGHEVALLERYPEARPAGIILNLWPGPVKALGLLGVDITDLGAGCHSMFFNSRGKLRADARPPEDVVANYGGGFIGMLRPDLYERMLTALPPGVLQVNRAVDKIEQDETGVRVHIADGECIEADVVVGADGIDSLVRRTLWGDSPKREHNLHVIGGYTFDEVDGAEHGRANVVHSRTVQGSWTAIRHKGRDGFQWWVLGAYDARQEFSGDPYATASAMVAGFPKPVPQLIAATSADRVQRWVLRDRKPLKKWSKGRAIIVGDAAHPTSPYAAYGAGMATEDGYYLGRRLAGVDLSDYAAVRQALDDFERPRIPHTTRQVQQAWVLGKVFHHAPRPLQSLRDLVLDSTPLMQKVVDAAPDAIFKQIDEIDRAELASASRRLGQS